MKLVKLLSTQYEKTGNLYGLSQINKIINQKRALGKKVLLNKYY